MTDRKLNEAIIYDMIYFNFQRLRDYLLLINKITSARLLPEATLAHECCAINLRLNTEKTALIKIYLLFDLTKKYTYGSAINRSELVIYLLDARLLFGAMSVKF